MAADWRDLMTPQRTMRPSVTRVKEQLYPRFAASRHTTTVKSISYMVSYLYNPCLLSFGGVHKQWEIMALLLFMNFLKFMVFYCLCFRPSLAKQP